MDRIENEKLQKLKINNNVEAVWNWNSPAEKNVQVEEPGFLLQKNQPFKFSKL